MNKHLKCLLKLPISLFLVLTVIPAFLIGMLSVLVMAPVALLGYISGCYSADVDVVLHFLCGLYEDWRDL